MVSTELETLVNNLKLSSVVPARATGEDKKFHELTTMDLATKLHYIRALYFFTSDSVRGLDISDLKKPMFHWLDLYSAASGRIRRSEENNGRPVVRCNDGGVRIVEGDCEKTLGELMEAAEERSEINDQLVYRHALGPDLGFSPLVFVQFTWFKCGGLSVGLSWAHVLGDAFSASAFINMWGHIMAGHMPPLPLNMPNTGNYQFPHSITEKPFSLKRVDPVGDYWLAPNSSKMETHSFLVTQKKLDHIVSRISGLNPVAKQQCFHFLAAVMWKSLAKVRGESGPRVVTICSNNSNNRRNEMPSNSQVIGTVEADCKVDKADLSELARLIEEKMVDERSVIDELVEKENGKSDFILYGANLTFVNLEDEEIYGLELQGKKPVFANYSVGGIGDEGVVLMLPGPENGKEGGGGRVVTAILPENQVIELKNELRKEWGAF